MNPQWVCTTPLDTRLPKPSPIPCLPALGVSTSVSTQLGLLPTDVSPFLVKVKGHGAMSYLKVGALWLEGGS